LIKYTLNILHGSRFFLYNIILVSIAFSVSICILADLGLANAQTPTPDHFLNYTSSTDGFKIIYPSNWEVKETDLTSDGDVVQFKSPEDRLFASLTVNVKGVSSYLDTDTMKLKNATAEQYGLQRLDVVSVMGQPDPDIVYKEIRSNAFPIDGQDAWKIEYIWGFIEGFYNLEVFTIANGKMYTFHYMDFPLNAPKNLPIVNRMIDSFQVIQ
jgi:hypothetical protein